MSVEHTTKMAFVAGPSDPALALRRILTDAAVLLDSLPAAIAAARRLRVVATPCPLPASVTLAGMLLNGICHDVSGAGHTTIRCRWGAVTDLTRQVVEVYRPTGRPPTGGRFTPLTEPYDGHFAVDLVDVVPFADLPQRLAAA